jgi:hypothetical protein
MVFNVGEWQAKLGDGQQFAATIRRFWFAKANSQRCSSLHEKRTWPPQLVPRLARRLLAPLRHDDRPLRRPLTGEERK